MYAPLPAATTPTTARAPNAARLVNMGNTPRHTSQQGPYPRTGPENVENMGFLATWRPPTVPFPGGGVLSREHQSPREMIRDHGRLRRRDHRCRHHRRLDRLRAGVARRVGH